jgi:hypothetical protein
MEDPRLKVIVNELRGYTGDCICDEAYTSRRLIDPSCSYHIVPNEEAAADILAALDAMNNDAPEEAAKQPATKWNVFLHDPDRKYGDYMVTVPADTAADAEHKALTSNPNAELAHPTALSVYGSAPEAGQGKVNPALQWGGLNGVLRG